MPEVAGSWPEEGVQYPPGAPMDAVPQQPYQAQAQYQQQYQQQAYEQQYPAQQQPQYPDQGMPQQAMYAEEEQSSVPSEFDHLFRDSTPDTRRSISGRQPMVSGPGGGAPGFQQQQQMQMPMQQNQATSVMGQGQLPEQGYADNGGPYGGQYGGDRYDGGPGGSGKSRTPLIIGVVVVVIAGVGLYLGLSGGSAPKSANANGGKTASTGAPASTLTAKQQADQVYSIVQQSKQLRSDINGEVGGLLSCNNVSGLQSEINTTAQARQSQATQVAKLDVSKIPNAAALISKLEAAWSDSANSDGAYAKVAGDFASGGSCSEGAVKADSNYSAARSESNAASAAKYDAAQQWNSAMASYEPQITMNDL